MKRFLVLVMAAVVVLSASFAQATSDIKFGWDAPSAADGTADATSLRIYQSATSGVYTLGPTSANLKKTITMPATEGTVTGVADGKWFFVATFVDAGGNESVKSNEVSVTLDTTPPGAPKNLRNVQVSITVTMKNGVPVVSAVATVGR